MNNKINLWRLHHEIDIKVGPYHPYVRDFNLFLKKHEPYQKERFKYADKIINNKINKFGISSFFLHRPGLLEDPILRYNLYSKKLIDKDRVIKRYKFCAFRDLDQFYAWFNDDEEYKKLIDNGFVLSCIKEKVENVVFGLKQVIVLKDM